MKIPLESLSETPQLFLFSGNTGWWQSVMRPERGLPRELAEPLCFRVSAYRIADDLCLEGELEGGVELECARCLARYRHPLRERFRLVLEPAGARTPSDPEGAAALERTGLFVGDELDAGWFRGSEIHLESLFMELVSLALPVQPLCREDCAGLCPRCGAELSTGPCGCGDAKSNSPFAVLASLRGGSTGGDS